MNHSILLETVHLIITSHKLIITFYCRVKFQKTIKALIKSLLVAAFLVMHLVHLFLLAGLLIHTQTRLHPLGTCSFYLHILYRIYIS